MGARPVGIEWPHDCCRQSVGLTIDLRIVFARELGSAIDGGRCAHCRLLGGLLAATIAIDLRRRAIQEPRDPLPARLLQHEESATCIYMMVLDRPAERTANALNCEVKHAVAVAHCKLDGGALENGALDNAQSRGARDLGEILAPTGGEIIEHGHRVAIRNQPVDEMRAEETGASGDQRTAFHRDARWWLKASRPQLSLARLASKAICVCSSSRTIRKPCWPLSNEASSPAITRRKCSTTAASGSWPRMRGESTSPIR